jgi:hypothetical protein
MEIEANATGSTGDRRRSQSQRAEQRRTIVPRGAAFTLTARGC